MTPHLADTPVLETERLTLRAIGRQDIDAAMAFFTSDRAGFIGGPYTPADAWDQIGHLIGHWVMRGFGTFAFCLKGTDKVLGEAGPFFPYGWCEHEIGWTLWQADHEGKGYAFEAARAARDFAFATLGWDTAVSYIDPANARSIALAARLGAALDISAPVPDLPDWDGTLVYRHPSPAQTGDVA